MITRAVPSTEVDADLPDGLVHLDLGCRLSADLTLLSSLSQLTSLVLRNVRLDNTPLALTALQQLALHDASAGVQAPFLTHLKLGGDESIHLCRSSTYIR